MKITEGMEEVLAWAPKQESYVGRGYAIDLRLPWGVRYRVGDRSLTVPSSLKGERDGSWWNWRSYYIPFYIESPMVWDNEEEPLSVEEAETVLNRLKDCFDKRIKQRYKFVFGTTEATVSYLQKG